ncbi:MAG: hypothetical protein KF767_16055 [Bdellovibrionaceae bacterium]|nr:hypothetical protein [Pseudobdellovibrionaceae bacterium]
MKAFVYLALVTCFFALETRAGSTQTKDYVDEVDYTQKLPAGSRCLFGCVTNDDGTLSPIIRRSTRPVPAEVQEEKVWVPNREVRYEKESPRACKFGCDKNKDGTFSPRVLVPKSQAAKYMKDTTIAGPSSADILAEENRRRAIAKKQADEQARLREAARVKARDEAIVAEETRKREIAKKAEAARLKAQNDAVVPGTRGVGVVADEPTRSRGTRDAALNEAVNAATGNDPAFNKGLREKLARDPLTSGFTTRQEFEAYMNSENFRNQPSVARLYVDARQRANEQALGVAVPASETQDSVRAEIEARRKKIEEEREAAAQRARAEYDRKLMEDQLPATPSYEDTTRETQKSIERLRQDQISADANVEAKRRELQQAELERARLKGTAADTPNGGLGVATPAGETTTGGGPCSNRKMSARELENCSMEQLKKDSQAADQAVARCFYSGFAAKNGANNVCQPVRSSKDAKDLGVKLNGVAETNCGGGMVMCNPLVFGVQSDKRAICVRGTKNASKDCAKTANLQSEDAKKRYQELMKDAENKKQFKELMAKHKRSCDAAAMVRYGEHEMNQIEHDRAFTANIKNRKDKEDHRVTCEVLGVAIQVAKEAQGAPESVALPTRGIQEGVPVEGETRR